MRNITRLLAMMIVLAGFATFAAADTIWNVNASFSYNDTANTATGTFELDPSLNLVTWDVTVAGTNTLADNVYIPGDSIAIFPDLTHLDFYDGSTNQYIDLYLASPLTNAGGTINLLYGDGGASNNSTVVCAGCGTLDSGTVSTVSATVPEPSSTSLLASVVGFLGLLFFLTTRSGRSSQLRSLTQIR
jgi:hypothetical protein